MLSEVRILVEGLNPEPWEAPTVLRRGGAFSSDALRMWRQGLRENIDQAYPNYPTFPKGTRLDVKFFFWRSSAYGQPADATNLQKSTEDALQAGRVRRDGFKWRGLYVNDRDTVRVTSEIMEQTPTTEPALAVVIQVFTTPTLADLGWWKTTMPIGPDIPGNVRLAQVIKENT